MSRTSHCVPDLPLSVKQGYKLRDFKPTYGLIFADEIGETDF
ncbi:MAG: DUF6625 family protein [Hyphomonas sp.]